MHSAAGMSGIYTFGDIRIDVDAHTVCCGPNGCTLEPKAFRVLLALMSRPGNLVTKDELLDSVWGHRAVTPNVLSHAITQIRHAIGDTAHQSRYIQTVPTLGYRFIACVQHLAGAHDAAKVAHFELNRNPAYSLALLEELNRLLANLNDQSQDYPVLTRHLSLVSEMFGNKLSGMVLYELALEYGLEKLNSLDLDLPWRKHGQTMADENGVPVLPREPSK